VFLLAFGALTFWEAPRLHTNLPTPWIGLWDRINMSVFPLWVGVLATSLLRAGTRRLRPPGETRGSARSIFRTETRAIATDAEARTKFRRYWSLLSPGIIVIRWMPLGPLKAEAERRATAECERNDPYGARV